MRSTLEASPETGGRSWFTERHVDDFGREHVVQSLRANDDPPDLAANAAMILAQLAETEAARNAELLLSGRESETVFEYSTVDDARAIVRARGAEVLAAAQVAANQAVAAATIDPTLAPAVQAAAAAVQEQLSGNDG